MGLKKFKFRLQRVLEFRHTLTKEKERELAIKNAELADAEERARQIVADQDRAEVPESEEMTMADLMTQKLYVEALQEALVRQREVVLEATAAVEAARLAYVEKAVEEETLETLKEKRLNEYKEEKHREERKELSSLVVQRYRFNK